MARRNKNDLVFIVTRPDTHGGFSMRARTHELTAVKAMKYATMKGATELQVRRFCGPAGTSDPVMVKV